MEAVSNTLKLDSSFLSRNYRIYLELSEPNGFKYHQTLIVIFISFVQLLMAHLHTYVLRFVGPDSFIDYLTTSFSYFDIYNLLRTSSFVYNIIFYVLCALAYFYLLTYTMLLLTPKANIKKSFWTTFFVYYCKYYSWMLFFPSVITLSARLLCPSHIMKTIEDSSLVCKGNIMESDPLISVLAGSGLIICVGMVGINGFFAYSTWYNKTDYFSTHYERFIPYFNLTRLIGTLLMVVPTEEKTYMLGYLTVHLGLGGFLLYLLLKYFPFSKIKVLKMFLFFILSYLGQSIGMLIDYLTLGTLYNNQTNSLLFMFVSFLALELGFFYFLEHHIMSYIKEKESTKGDFLEMIKKIRILHYVSGSFTPSYVIYFKGLLTLHFETCRNPSCFCKAEKVFDAKKGRELEVSKKSAMKGVFAKYLIRNWFEEHIAFDKKDPRPSIFYADFLFNKLKNVHMALTQLALAERKAFGFNEKRKILQHKEQITAFIREKNEEFRKGNLAFEIVVFLEEQLDKLLHLKRRFLKRSVKFWQILENPFLNLTELNGELSKLMSIKSELAILWSPLTPYLDSKKQLKFYYQWYLKTILNKKLKVADEEIKTLESFDEEDVMSIGSKELFSENKHKDKLIYQPDCCVLHVKSAANALAGIWKVNSGVKEVFDYNKSEIIGSEIARLMSPFFARLHPGFVGNFIKSSRSHALYNTKYAFGLNKSGFIFPLWLVLKQFVDPLGNLEYISMIKPLKSKKSQSDYIILDQYGIIDGVSKGITKNLLLEPELIKKMKINILLISPKLIRFFTYEKYLKKDDESLSEKKKKKDKRAQKRKEFEKAKKTMKDKAEKEKTLKSPNGVRSEDRKIPQIKKTWMLASGNKELEVNETLAESPKHEKQFSSRKSIIKKTFINIHSPESNTNAKTKKEKGFNDLMGLKEQVGPSHKESFLNNEKVIQIKKNDNSSSSESNTGNSSSASSGLNEDQMDGVENIVNFYVKLPMDIEKYVSYYHELTAKKKFSYTADNSLKLFSKTIKEDPLELKKNSINNLNSNKNNELISAVVSSNTTAKLEEKEQKNEETIKRELKAIVLTAERIAKNRLLNIYKIRAVISSKAYGQTPNECLKVLKVLSIQKKVEKFTNITGSMQRLSNIPEEFIKSASNINVNLPNDNEKVLNLSPTLTNKFFQSKSNTNELSVLNLEEAPKNEGNYSGELSPVEQSPILLQNYHSSSAENNQNQEIFPQNKFVIKNFQKTKGSNTENLFLKEDTLKAHRNLRSISKIKWFIRLLFLWIFSLSLLTYLLGPFSEFQALKNKSQKIYLTKSNELNILQSYNVMLNFIFLSTGLFDDILDNSTLTNYLLLQKEDFFDIYGYLISMNSDPLMKNVIFDSSVFPPIKTNYTSTLNSISNTYDIWNKDLLFLYIEKLNNIYNISDFKIDSNDSNLAFFRQYILPTLSDMLNRIERRLFDSISATKDYIDAFMLYILISEISLLCLTFILLLRYILQVTASFQAIIEVFTYIENIDVRSVKRHFQNILISFAKTVSRTNEDESMTEKTSKMSKGTFIEGGTKEIGEKNAGSEQQFKKLKKFKVGLFLSSLRKTVLFYYLLFIVVSSCLSIGFFFLVKTATGQIETLLQNGRTIIDLVDGDSILLIAAKENTYDSNYYQKTLYPRIKTDLLLYLKLETKLFLPSIDFAKFDQISTAYFYTNPCLLHANLTEIERNECGNVSLGKLSLGMVSFNNYFINKISDFLLVDIENKFGEISLNDLYQFDRGVYYSNKFILDILKVWSQDMSDVLDTSYQNLTIYLAFMLFGLIGSYIVAERLVVGRLRIAYKYYRQIYNNFMPTDLVNKERLIKARLVIANVLNK